MKKRHGNIFDENKFKDILKAGQQMLRMKNSEDEAEGKEWEQMADEAEIIKVAFQGSEMCLRTCGTAVKEALKFLKFLKKFVFFY